MAGKPLVMIDSKPLKFALDKISKNTAIDMLLDCCQREIGDLASDVEIANWFTLVLEPVSRQRGDKPLNVGVEMSKYSKAAADYVALHSSKEETC